MRATSQHRMWYEKSCDRKDIHAAHGIMGSLCEICCVRSPCGEVLRSVAVYMFLVVALRLGGKRELAQ